MRRMIRRSVLMAAAAPLVSGCGPLMAWMRPAPPRATAIEVHKGARRMYLMDGPRVLRRYDIALGSNPTGHKRAEGDGRTPEGSYVIDRRNPNSQFHLSLGISYPRPSDRLAAREAGLDPGGDIFIHGQAGRHRGRGRDWTEGCIAVTDREIEEIYAMVDVGTPIRILP